MNFNRLRSQYHALSSQFIVADATGLILESDERIVPAQKGQSIKDIHGVIESSWDTISELLIDEEYYLPCVSAHVDDELLYFDFVFRPVSENEQRYLTVTVMDLTPQYLQILAVVQEKNQSNILNELLRSQSKMEALERELLAKQNEELERIQELKNEFLATMTHEIRTPLNAILGLTHIMIDEGPRTDQLDTLETIRFSGENLLGLISDILDFSKIEANKIELENVVFDLNKLCHALVQGAAIRAEAKGITCDLQLHQVPDFIEADSVRISQIINNLLTNAVKFTESGGVTLAVELVSQEAKVARLLFQVTDTGIGIPYDRQEDIFNKFTQAEVSTTRKYGGTGLGLAISKRLVELMGSSIQLESHPGKGSTFSFTLTVPVHQSPASTKMKDNRVKIEDLNLKILVVEDNTVNQLVARKILERWNIQVQMASNGSEALELLQTATYNIVLMDLLMPEMDGYETTRKIRQELKNQTPIIALTASSTSSVRKATEEAGMNGFVSKPFKPKALQEAILNQIPL
ncbi:MAG TPA: hybrid sensor histidine kinase/response regulator [Cytophagales bacterium]|nr:hybrid sensor histidine kinase/response regulator [Cytophagales bacterium]HAA23435.1 hybrid sensor histidine kinase/response regulator [Cytophagales bacterium]HAP58630.1 hybrid sensor histidine kinase/response regulator [Cytophagales bacterium]